jgi:glycogen operon protein
MSNVEDFESKGKSVAYKSNFDWQGDKPLQTPMEDSIIYELHVKGFTAEDESLPVNLRGTYRGLMAKIPWLKEQGYTSVELMPIFKFDRAAFNIDKDTTAPKYFVDPVTHQILGDAWGYNPISYRAPEERYAADGNMGQQVDEFKALVRELHKNNIEVILDVVFNHTGEGGRYGVTTNLKGLGNERFYMLDPSDPTKYINASGCGNTLNTNDPMTQRMILEALRYWVQDMHVDGFRFDLATVFNLMVKDGKIVDADKTPIIKAIEEDPVLANTKLIAEPWAADGQYRLGRFSDKRWAEWNGDFRDKSRSFVRGDEGQTGTLADRIAGSPGWFDVRTGRHSVNFVTAHDGFTLNDLVSYAYKHNARDGEGGAGGSNDNISSNHGVEGPTDDPGVLAARTRDMKNFYGLLMLSRGTPMDLYGNDMRRTQLGNNNTWNREDMINVDWKSLGENEDMLRFRRMYNQLQLSHKIGWSAPENYRWFGANGQEMTSEDWRPSNRMLAWELLPSKPGVKTLYQAFNAWREPIKLTLPEGNWHRLVDSNLPMGQDIVTPNNATPLDREYVIQPGSHIVLEGDK